MAVDQAGTSLVEVLVALTLLGIGGSLSVGLLQQAERDLQGAEVGLRAALLLAEVWDQPSGSGARERTAGPGALFGERDDARATVRFEPPSDSPPFPVGFAAGTGGYLEARTWRLDALR